MPSENQILPLKTSKALPSRKIARVFNMYTDAVQFLLRKVWPLVDLIFRVWMAQQLLVSALLLTTGWKTAVFLAANEYPIPWLSPQWEAFLGIVAQFFGGFTLLLGLFTRAGAVVVLAFAVVTQAYYTPLDLNLLWITLMAVYILRGAGPISLDSLLEQGFRRSALPFAGPMVIFLKNTQELFANIFLLALRIWLVITLLLVAYYSQSNLSAPIQSIWLPLQSAWFSFGSGSFFLALLLGLGLGTRLAAISGVVLIFLNYSTGSPGFYSYWVMIMAFLIIFGPGFVSVDQVIYRFLAKRFPQLSGKPAFNLEELPHVVIIGAGFGGISCARALCHEPVRITLIDRHNYHLFQPLLYQVATGSLSPADIAISIRSIFLKQYNVEIRLGHVRSVNKEKRLVIADEFQMPYDYLVIATGATHSYFGKDHWAPYAPGLKTVNDATAIRSRIVEAFEWAELAKTHEKRQELLTFIIVGAGPTGVELAGAIAELARFGIEQDYRCFDPASAKIILIQASDRILPGFSEITSVKAQKYLSEIGVTIRVNSMVEQIDEDGVIVNGERICSKTVFWAAGVAASPAAKWLNLEADPAGRVRINPYLEVPDYPELFVIGDTATIDAWEGKSVPGIAPAAKQEGLYVAKAIAHKVYQKPLTEPFHYHHAGNLATIGRKAAVAEFEKIRLSGEAAWWFWGLIHISFLVGGRNRISVLLNWLWAYFTLRANNLLITDTNLQVKKPKIPPKSSKRG